MKRLITVVAVLIAIPFLPVGCETAKPPGATRPDKGPEITSAAKPAEAQPAEKPAPVAERIESDTPRTTTEGNKFIAPAGWSITVRGPATILEPPESGSVIALVDVRAKNADEAVAAAWKAYMPEAKWPLKVVNKAPDKDGWTDRSSYGYQTSPNEKRGVGADVQRAGDVWTVAIYNMDQAVGEKRLAQVALIYGQLLPKGYTRESFAGKKANRLDKKRIAELGKFVETAMHKTGVPGVGLGLLQDGKVVFAGGFGVRELGKKKKINADTLFMIASNTKAMTTLLLGKLVDEKKLTWDTPVTTLLPSFKLGDEETTRQVKVKHLICACTGLPRQDFEWIFEFGKITPKGAVELLASMQPTSKFGEIFQYSNLLAGAAGFIGGHVAYPKLELGAAYDKAMQTRVFNPLRMKATTFNYKAALSRNHAMPHSHDVDGKPARSVMDFNYGAIPVRPAGAAWSNVRDVLSYVSMELAEGKLPGGKSYISRDVLFARRDPQVSIGKDITYGMGLMVDTKYGVPVIHHGGDIIGFHSDMMWLPGHGVGAVVLTNGDPGWIIRSQFRRKLLEVLFDGKSEAEEQVAAAAKTYFDQLAAERKLLTAPADAAETKKLAKHYVSDALGEIKVSTKKGATYFDFGEWKSEMASKKNPDGTVSFVTIAPGITGLEFMVGSGEKRTLITRDAQHEYVFTEK